MTIQQFSAATNYVQRTMVRFHGHFLLKKREQGAYCLLYEVDGFYVVITYSESSSHISSIKSYTLQEIDEYLSLIDISPITDLLR